MNLLELFVKIGVKDEVSSKLETVSATAIAKGQLIASAIQNAVQRAMGAIQSFLGSALSAFGQYQQQVGGMETFFGDSANTVIANAKRAYETAGMSANQYMSNVSGFAMSLITSVAKRRNKVVQQDTETQAKALDTQVDNLSEALSRNLTNRQRELSAEYQARSDELSDELEQLQDALARQLKERQKALDREVSDFQKATDKRLKEIDREYTERLKLTDEEEYRRIKALQDQNDALDAETDAERKAQKSREQQQKIADLKREAATAKFIEDREKAERELADYLADIEQDSREEQRNEQKKANNDEIQRIKDEFDKKRKQIREQQSQEVEDYKETRARELEELRESNARKLEEMSEANRRTIKEQQRANRDILRDMQNAHNDELQAMRDSNSRQLKELQNSLANQKSALADSADAVGDYIETTAEDQAEAARIADMAMRDMSDNANKMGTDMGLIQNAYQGFAKQNFTMLDNLKLGFGGTKEEMERLLETAEQIQAKNGEVVDYSIDSFADIVQAIHVVQQEMGITGTTATEGATTIEGAVNRVKGAWENWLVSLADPELDVAESTRQLMESVGDAAGLIIPRVATILETLFTYVSEHGPEIWEQFKQSMMDSLPEEWQTKVGDARKAIEDFFGAVETAGKALQPFVNVIIWAGNEIKGVADIIDGAIRFITGAPKKVDDSMGNTDGVLEKHGEAVMDGFARGAEWSWDENKGFFSNIGSWIQEHKGPLGADAVLLEPAGRAIIDGFMGGASSSWNSQNHMFGEMASSIGMMFNGSENLLWTAGHNIIVGLMDGSERGWPDVQGFFLGIPNSITGLFSGSGSWLQGNGVEILNGLQSGMGNAWNSVASFVSSIPSGITGAFSNAGDWLVGAGSNIMTGLYNGLVSIYNNYIQPLISGVGSWIQQHKGPESYDKKLLVNNGKWIMGGFQSGLESGFEGGVIPYVSGMGRDIQDAIGASVSSPFATTVGRAVATPQQRQQPTMITAILELDRVQFGRLVYQLNGEESQRMGVNLAGGMA